AIASDPQAMDPRCFLGLAYLNLNRLEPALNAADAAVRVAPGNEWPHRLRCLILRRMGKAKDALAAALEAARLAPELPDALTDLARSQVAFRQVAAARATAT